MMYLCVFLLGGTVCLVTQLLFRLTGISVGNILTAAFCLGVVFSALGWITPLANFGQSGIFLLLYGGGDAAYQGMEFLLEGDPSGILLSCFVLW